MPIFMDLHISPNGEIAIEDLIEKHQADLAIQHKYDVKFKGMWVNKEQGMVFCLMEGPDKEACTCVHQEAHGDNGCNVIEVSPGDYDKYLFNSFTNEDDIAEIERGKMDTGYRTVFQFECIDPRNQRSFESRDLQAIIKYNKGVLLIDPHQSLKAVFVHSAKAFRSADQIMKYVNSNYPNIDYRIAMVSGKPVDENNDQFYGHTTSLVEKLIKSSLKGVLRTTQLTVDLMNKEGGNNEDIVNPIEVLSLPDVDFLYQIIDCIESKINNPEFSATDLANTSFLSRSQLFRKIKQLTGYTPNTLIREIRLYEAVKLLNQKSDQIAQIAYNTGFNSPSYFSKIFAKRFKILPSTYIQSLEE